MAEEERAFVKITPDKIYEVAIQTRDSVRDLNSAFTEVAKDIKDHEDRIRAMEKKQWGYGGLGGLVGGILTLFATNADKIGAP